MEYSVLMSVYAKEKPEFFAEAIQSMLNQTVKTNDFVIVCDGPLTKDLENVLQKYEEAFPEIIKAVRLPHNVGTGLALNEGLGHCRNELIAKMDSDDISVPNRCEQQLKEFEKNSKLTVLGGYIKEFIDEPNNPISQRIVPCDNIGIRKYAKRRQPFNNVTVMYKKSAVIKVGAYKELTRSEDYDLYVRILGANYYCENIAETLVNVRIKDKGMDRRVSSAAYKGFIYTRWCALQSGYSGIWDFLIACGAQTAVYLAPGFIQDYIYRKMLHKPIDNKNRKG